MASIDLKFSFYLGRPQSKNWATNRSLYDHLDLVEVANQEIGAQVLIHLGNHLRRFANRAAFHHPVA